MEEKQNDVSNAIDKAKDLKLLIEEIIANIQYDILEPKALISLVKKLPEQTKDLLKEIKALTLLRVNELISLEEELDNIIDPIYSNFNKNVKERIEKNNSTQELKEIHPNIVETSQKTQLASNILNSNKIDEEDDEEQGEDIAAPKLESTQTFLSRSNPSLVNGKRDYSYLKANVAKATFANRLKAANKTQEALDAGERVAPSRVENMKKVFAEQAEKTKHGQKA